VIARLLQAEIGQERPLLVSGELGHLGLDHAETQPIRVLARWAASSAPSRSTAEVRRRSPSRRDSAMQDGFLREKRESPIAGLVG